MFVVDVNDPLVECFVVPVMSLWTLTTLSLESLPSLSSGGSVFPISEGTVGGVFFWLDSLSDAMDFSCLDSSSLDPGGLDPSESSLLGGAMACLPLIVFPDASADGVGINVWNLCFLALRLGDCLMDGTFLSSFFFSSGMQSGCNWLEFVVSDPSGEEFNNQL